ncbi:MAG: biotin/lipoyl-containing protein, partial [Hyphomicrobium sp.]
MSSIEVKVPDIGDYKNVPIIEVHVKAGDKIRRDDPLVTLESDKAAMEVPAPEAGEVAEILVKVGDKVSEGSAIIRLSSSDAKPAKAQPAAKAAPASAPASAEPTKAPAASDSAAPREPGQPPARVPLPLGTDYGNVHASPSVRRFAREFDIDISRVTGTGEKGRITKDDVKRALAGSGGGGGSGIPEIPAQDFAKFGPIETQAMSRLKRLSGPHLHRAWLNIPHVTHRDEA